MTLFSGTVRAMGVSMAIVFAMAVICSIAISAPAAGLEPGVHADPGSPAAKEYALPLNQARQTGSGSHAGPVAPFGAGIQPAGGSGSGSAASRPSASRAVHSGSTSASVRRPGGSLVRRIVPAAVLRIAGERGSSDGDGSILTLLGGGIAVLVLGGFCGMVLRRGHWAETNV